MAQPLKWRWVKRGRWRGSDGPCYTATMPDGARYSITGSRSRYGRGPRRHYGQSYRVIFYPAGYKPQGTISRDGYDPGGPPLYSEVGKSTSELKTAQGYAVKDWEQRRHDQTPSPAPDGVALVAGGA